MAESDTNNVFQNLFEKTLKKRLEHEKKQFIHGKAESFADIFGSCFKQLFWVILNSSVFFSRMHKKMFKTNSKQKFQSFI